MHGYVLGLFVCLSVRPSVGLPVCLSVRPSVWLFVRMYSCMYVYTYVCMYVWIRIDPGEAKLPKVRLSCTWILPGRSLL